MSRLFGTWEKTGCDNCGEEFQVSRTEPRIIKGDVLCDACESFAEGIAEGIAEGRSEGRKHAELVERLEKDPAEILATITPTKVSMLHGALGMCGEAGEASEMVKKHVFAGKILDANALLAELGDTLFYMTMMLNTLGLTIEDAQLMNRNKLEKRFPGGKFTNADAEARVDVESKCLHLSTTYNMHGDNRICLYCREVVS